MRRLAAFLIKSSAFGLAALALACASARRKQPEPTTGFNFEERSAAIRTFAQETLKPALDSAWLMVKEEGRALKQRLAAFAQSQ